MTDTAVDPYGLSTGLLSDFSGRITEAYFGYSTGNYTDADGNPVIVLTLEIDTDNPDKPHITENFSVGANWAIEDGGKKLVRERGKNQFSDTSRAGELLAYALKSGAGDVMKKKGIPMEAATWQGLSFYWERVDITGRDGTVKQRLLPTKFEGGVDTSTASGPAATPTSNVDGATLAKLIGIAQTSADHDTFLDRAFTEIDSLGSNQAAVELVASGTFFAEHSNKG